ncbi:MAG: FAD-binding oxidoreductase [Candidatus Glassbacteria bacterium]
MEKEKLAEISGRLVEILGGDSVESSGPRLVEYASDMTENPPHPPELVVFPGNTDQVSACLSIAQEYGVPVVPRVYNTNLGGLAIPQLGGIVIDLTKMNRIIEVNPDDLYMIIEPGVTQEDVHNLLEKDFPELRFGYSLAPPEVSVLANCIMDGLVNLSYRYGAMGQWVNGLEVVLPGGRVVRTGSSAVVESWHGEPPLPHLSSLFFNAFGTTGVVTKAAIQLWPRPEFEDRYFILCGDTTATERLILRLSRSEIPDDIGILSWPLGKLLFGNRKPLYRDPAEPLFIAYVSISSNRKTMINEKIACLRDLTGGLRDEGMKVEYPLNMDDLIRLEPSFAKFSRFPTRLDFLLDHEGEGLTWLGTYGPFSRWTEGAEFGMDLLLKNGMPPLVVSRPMWGGHFIVLRFIMMFDRSDGEELGKVRRLNRELFEKVIELGFIPYKTPPWAYRLLAERMDPAFRNLMEGISHLVDPHKIMNPGKWPI